MTNNNMNGNGTSNGKGYNWNLIKQDYCEGMTWEQIQEKHSVSKAAMSSHFNKDGWEDAKIKYQMEVANAVKEKSISAKVHSLSKFNAICEEGADQANRLARNAIIKISNQGGETLDIKKLTDLMKVQREALEVKRLINDVPLPKQRIENTPEDKSPSEELEERVREQVNQIKPNSGE